MDISSFRAIKNGIIMSLTFVICTTGIVYAAISWPATPSGETTGGKFASVLNAMLSSGDWKNPWDGSVKSAQKLSTDAQAIAIYLNACGGPCLGSDPIGQWINLATKNLAWGTRYNTAPTNFSHDNKGTITVAEAGTYMIYMEGMATPSVDCSYVGAYAPYVNWTLNASELYSLTYDHTFRKAGLWAQSSHKFFVSLSAGSTVSYSWNPQYAHTYWGHDSYTYLRIIRVR